MGHMGHISGHINTPMCPKESPFYYPLAPKPPKLGHMGQIKDRNTYNLN